MSAGQHPDLLAFLKDYRPHGYTTLVAVVPDGRTEAATFNGANPSHAEKWIVKKNAYAGAYFTVNETKRGQCKKPAKEDIVAINAVWADIDPRDDQGHAWADERKRLHALAMELNSSDQPPTWIIDSGNGIQPIWLLADPIEATDEYRDAAEELCTRIEHALGASGTFNVDRLLRLPGTRNYPNKRKRKLGRGETETKLVGSTGALYSWAELESLATKLERSPPKHAEPIKPKASKGAKPGALPPYPSKEEIDALLARDSRLADIWHKTGRKAYADDSSRWDQSFANRLAGLDLDRDRICAFLRAYRAKHDPDKRKQDRADYLWRTVDSALAWIANRRAAQQPGKRRAVEILKEWIEDEFKPLFREGPALWSGTYVRPLKPHELAPTTKAIDSLADASDAKRDEHGIVKLHALPALARTWIGPAVGDVISALPFEYDAPEICPAAAARFRFRLARLLATMVTISSGRGVDRQDERRSLRGWCETFAEPDVWGQLRTYKLWFRRTDRLEIAIRPELAHQVGGNREIAELDFETFAALAERYDAGGRAELEAPAETTAVMLSADFLDCEP